MKAISCTLITLTGAYCLCVPIGTAVEAFTFAFPSAPLTSLVPPLSSTSTTSSLPTSLFFSKEEGEENFQGSHEHELLKFSRRRFMGDIIMKSTGIAATASAGLFVNLDLNLDSISSHSLGCKCGGCISRAATIRPLSASASETQIEDGLKLSADYYAQVIQVRYGNW